MGKVASLLIIAVVVNSVVFAEMAAPNLTKNELQAINRIIKSIEDCDPKRPGESVCEVENERIYLTGVVSDRGRQCVVVQFTVEAGNAEYQYLLVLERPTLKRFGPLRIGGRGYRHIEIQKIENGLIRAKVQWYGPKDPLAVPSVAGESSFSIDFSGLIERYSVVGE